MDEIPAFLRLTKEQRAAAWKGRTLTAVKAAPLPRKRRIPWHLPRTIDAVGFAILKQQERARKERQAARLAALKDKAW